MDNVTLGRTGLRVSVLGLGGGGHSQLGRRTDASVSQSVAIVRRALELGVNFIDTVEAYGTEELIGKALHGVDRSDVVLSTKKSITNEGRLITAGELAQGLEASLTRLQTDYVDVYHLHGVQANQYDMVGFNILNQSARDRVFAETRRHDTGVLCMFAVRDALSRPEKLRQTVIELVQQGLVAQDAVDVQDPLGFITGVDGLDSLPDAAYRFCRAEPGTHVVLSGTGYVQHLEQNVTSILRPPLPNDIREKLMDLFARVDTVSGQ